MSQTNHIQHNTMIQGELTGAVLGGTDGLFMPPVPDCFGMERRPLTEAGLKLSLELSRMAYTLELEPWLRAGWTDFSVQVDNQLTTGIHAREDEKSGERVQSVADSLRLMLARMAMKEVNPVSQLTGALRQREQSDTLKAVVMVKPIEDKHFVLAIGFMGTGTRFYDWFSNFRVGTEGGFHKGFYQLMQGFVRNETEILFPDTAQALGLETLTLKDILLDMRREDSRFSLWMAGHSQGAAVMQVYCHHLLKALGIQESHILGCGFASPTVAVDNAATGSGTWPLYHVLNADDLVPRMGSLKHFGFCLQYTPDAGFRDAAYDWSQTQEARDARKDAQRLTLYITNTLSFLSALTALFSVICEEKTDEAIFGGTEGFFSVAPIEKVFSFAGKKAKDSLMNMISYMKKSYREIRGQEMDEAAIRFLMERFRPIVKSMPLKQLLSALYDQLYPPHSLCRAKTMNGAYLRIVRDHSHELTPFLWQDGTASQPHRLYATGYYTFGRAPRARRVRTRARRQPRRRRAIQKMR